MNALFFLVFFVVLVVVTVRGLARAVKRASSAASTRSARVISAGTSTSAGVLDANTLKTLEALAAAKLEEVRTPVAARVSSPPPLPQVSVERPTSVSAPAPSPAAPSATAPDPRTSAATPKPQRRNEPAARTAASIARDLRESQQRDGRVAAVPVRSPDDRAADVAALAKALTVAVERTLANAEHSPRLSISSSLVRPLVTLYSAIVRIGAADESAARRALATVASESRFFGLGLAAARELDEAHLVAASASLRRADASLRAAVEHDLGVLELTLDGAAATEIAALRRLVA
jgi:hypothetical protein